MSPPVILDAGPSLNFFATNSERLLIRVVGPLTLPRTVYREIAGKAARDPRFESASRTLGKLRGSKFLTVLDDVYSDTLGGVVVRMTGQSFARRVLEPKNLGEIMVIAHAVVLAEAGTDVGVLVDDGQGARLATLESRRLRRLQQQGRSVGTVSLMRTATVLEKAIRDGCFGDRGELRKLYERTRGLDDGLVPIEDTGLLHKPLWRRKQG